MPRGRNSFASGALAGERPASLWDGLELPSRQHFHPSPIHWRDEVVYFLLVDRFSDGREDPARLLDRGDLPAARPAAPDGSPWLWWRWAESGSGRFQGGTLAGVASKLDYLAALGMTAIWLSPVFKQRGHDDSYHGYGIQDFLDVDPRFGTRADLVDLVAAAHERGLRVILDVIFNHSGENWVYAGGEHEPPYTPGQHAFGAWRGPVGESVAAIEQPDDGVWPRELQDPERYTRAGKGSLGAGDIGDPQAEHKRTDFLTLRDFALDAPGLLTDLARCYKYWIALSDCDGFRIDTLKHVDFEEARNFCGSIKEFAANLGKDNFFLVGEVAGGDTDEDRYLDVLGQNLNAALDIAELRLSLRSLAKGLDAPAAFFDGFDPGRAVMGSHRNLGDRHVSVLDDHDHVWGEKLRFSVDAAPPHQAFAGVALQLLTLGVPCVYYGTEQALAGPEPPERRWLPDWGRSDRYLREAMFGPEHPRAAGRAGLEALDETLPGFGPFGTAGRHCFDDTHPVYRRIAGLAALRREYPVLRGGRQYLRPIRNFGLPFGPSRAGELVAWSRILDDEEALCVLNPNGTERRGGDVLVDADLNPDSSSFTVVFDSAGAAGARLPVRRAPDGSAYVEIRDVAPAEVLVLSNAA